MLPDQYFEQVQPVISGWVDEYAAKIEEWLDRSGGAFLPTGP